MYFGLEDRLYNTIFGTPLEELRPQREEILKNMHERIARSKCERRQVV